MGAVAPSGTAGGRDGSFGMRALEWQSTNGRFSSMAVRCYALSGRLVCLAEAPRAALPAGRDLPWGLPGPLALRSALRSALRLVLRFGWANRVGRFDRSVAANC